MKHVILAVPVMLLSVAAIAQTEAITTEGVTGDAAASGEFGTSWPLSIGTTFFGDADSATLRSTEELAKGWQSLSPEDQAMVRADCEAFLAAHGDGSADASAGASASTDTTASAGAAATDTTASGTAATDTTATGTASTDADASTGTDAATTAPAGYDMAEMKAICEAVGSL